MKRRLLLVFILCISKDFTLTTVSRNQGFAIAGNTTTSSTMVNVTNTMKPSQEKSMTVLSPSSTMVNVTNTMKPSQEKSMTVLSPSSTMVNVTNTMKPSQEKRMTVLSPSSTMINVTNTMKPEQKKSTTEKSLSIVLQTTATMNYSLSSTTGVFATIVQSTSAERARKSTNVKSENKTTISMMDSSAVIFPSRTSTMQSSSSSLFVLKTTPESKPLLILTVSVKFEKEFNDNLRNKQSQEFLTRKKEVEDQITMAYKDNKNFVSVTITGFKPGSIICEGRLYFKNSTNDDFPALRRTLEDYGAGNGFKVENIQIVDKIDDDDDDEGDVILGLHWWQIGVIIGGVVVFILLITIFALCCKISRIKKQSRSNSSHISNAYYDNINELEEMKSLRATPSKAKSTPENVDMESGQRRVNMYSSSSSVNAKNDGLVNKTSSKIGKDNAGADVEDDYVSIVDSFPSAGNVVKL